MKTLEKDCEVRVLSNDELLSQTKELVLAEREIGIRILHRLREIYRRRLHCELGHSSIFTYLVSELRYPESSAFRLVSAMKITSEIPETVEKIKSGALSITTVAQVQSYCQAQKRENGLMFKSEEKKELLHAIEGHSKKEVDVILASYNPEHVLPKDREKVRLLNAKETEIRFVADEDLIQDLERIKDLMAHKNWNPSYAELFKEMTEIVLNKIDPARKPDRKPVAKQESKMEDRGDLSGKSEEEHRLQSIEVENHLDLNLKGETGAPVSSFPNSPSPTKAKRVYLSVFRRRDAFKKANYQCTFRSTEGHRCTEKRGLQIEHRVPISQGGTNDSENLTVLCAHHNLFQAVQVLGRQTMARYIHLE